MTVRGKFTVPDPPADEGARWRTIGAVVLALGIVGAGLVYSLEKPPMDVSDILPTAHDSKVVARNIEVNTGKAGVFMLDLMDALQVPGTQALIIAVVSILAASACFYIAHLSDNAARR